MNEFSSNMFCDLPVTSEIDPEHVGTIDPVIGCQNEARPTVRLLLADEVTPAQVLGLFDGLPSIVEYREYKEYERYGCCNELTTPP